MGSQFSGLDIHARSRYRLHANALAVVEVDPLPPTTSATTSIFAATATNSRTTQPVQQVQSGIDIAAIAIAIVIAIIAIIAITTLDERNRYGTNGVGIVLSNVPVSFALVQT